MRTSVGVDAMVVGVPLARHRDEPNRMHDEGPCNCSAMSTPIRATLTDSRLAVVPWCPAKG